MNKIGIQIIQDIENGQNHKRNFNVAGHSDEGKVCEKNLLGSNPKKGKKLVDRAMLTKNADKGIGLEQQINPGR